MAEKRPRQDKGEEQPAAASVAGQATAASSSWRRFEEAHQRFVTSLLDARTRASEARAERWRRYSLAFQEAQLDAQAKVGDAYRAYTMASYEQWAKEAGGKLFAEGRQSVAEVQRSLIATSAEAQLELQGRLGEAWKEFATAEVEAGKGEDLAEAYRSYLQELQELWGGLDVTAVAPVQLAAIAQNLVNAAWSAQNVLGPGC
ncbi:MAG TPA: hypothetical protein VMW75_07860 [Thermoanaerobaculia bacterium]|nr:hypothetical protein [Thermoanaerobaculia bacterium]